MRWQVSYTRNILIAAALLLAGAMAAYLIRHQQPTRIGFPVNPDNGADRSYTGVTLTVKEFHPAGNQFTGSVVIAATPRWERLQQVDVKEWAAGFSHILLRMNRRKSQELTFQGGSEAPISMAFPPAWGSLMGSGTFTWNGEPQPGAFYYPFDRYTLIVNPELMEVSNPEVYSIQPIHSMQVEFENSNLVPGLHPLQAWPHHDSQDMYRISLERPAILRYLAIIVAVLLVIWLVYLIVVARPEEYAGHVVTLFVGVFSIRGSLLSGAPVFPSLIDYCALGVYLSAVLIVLIKWRFPDKKTQTCRFCQSSIPLAATVCPQCTEHLNAVS